MFKFMGKEINAIFGAQTILIWTYATFSDAFFAGALRIKQSPA